MMTNIDKIIISIEGNIGVGKSTFINILKSKWNEEGREGGGEEGEGGCEIIPEPVDMWKNITNTDGKNILQTFYEDIPRWAYSFQNVACITRMIKMEECIRNTNKRYIFLDRSLGTDKNVFEAMLYDNGQINQLEHSMYNLWCDFYHQYVRSQTNQIYIYLKASPETCASRIKKRGRVEEETIGLEYLKGLNDYHDKWLYNEPNVIILNCEEEFETDIAKHNYMIKQIKTKLDSIFGNKKIQVEFESDKKNLTNPNNIVLENM